MDRKSFIRNSALLSAPLLLKGIPVHAGNTLANSMLNELAKSTNTCNKILVVIQMNGGNDGLNMVIPRDKAAQLAATGVRPDLMMPDTAILKLNDITNTTNPSGINTTTGLHPAMTGLQQMYNAGEIVLVQGVSYPNPNYSHFQAQDIYFTASDYNVTMSTGWMGRDLDAAYANFPNGYPSTQDPDPLAIQIGGALPLSLQGPNINMGYNVPNPAALANVANATTSSAPASDYGTELTFLRLMTQQSNAYTSRITTAYNAQQTLSTQYAASGVNGLSDQLKIVARLIGGGLKTPIYVVNHPDSFDTHVGQVIAGNTTTGWHATSLSKLSVAISAFMNDVGMMGKGNRVAGMTFSEFGRRVIENASTGTDHGSAMPIIFFGSSVTMKGGIIGSSPTLPTTITSSTQVPMQYDFRQLYKTVMEDWLCMTPSQSTSILTSSAATPAFTKLSIFNQSASALPLSGIDLQGTWQNSYARLDFKVYENEALDIFQIERSSDAISFYMTGTVTNTSNISVDNYSYLDDRTYDDAVYYRIKGILKDSSIIYSKTIKLSNNTGQQLCSIYPNPVKNHQINIEFFTAVTDNVSIVIYDAKGVKQFSDVVNANGKLIKLNVPDMFTPETLYLIKVSYSANEMTEKIFFGE